MIVMYGRLLWISLDCMRLGVVLVALEFTSAALDMFAKLHKLNFMFSMFVRFVYNFDVNCPSRFCIVEHPRDLL